MLNTNSSIIYLRKKISLNSSDPFHINANIKTTNWNVLQVKIVVNAKRKVKIKLININGESTKIDKSMDNKMINMTKIDKSMIMDMIIVVMAKSKSMIMDKSIMIIDKSTKKSIEKSIFVLFVI